MFFHMSDKKTCVDHPIFFLLAEAARGSSLRATEAESRMCQTFGKAGLMFHTHTHACTTERIIIQKIFKCKRTFHARGCLAPFTYDTASTR